MARDKYIVGNWKMNQTLSDIDNFFKILDKNGPKERCHAWVAPQAIHIQKALDLAKKNNKIRVGGQNCSYKEKGAFTGELSPVTLKETGATFVIIGHSERRAIFGESDQILNEKTKLALNCGLTVIFCVGETLEEREANKVETVIEGQIINGLTGIGEEQLKNVIIAYEPVWAIGTGKTATPEQAEDVHLFIRNLWEKKGHKNPEELIILYGGSVKPANVQELMSKENIDGALVGGASLKGEDFSKLL